MEQRFYESWMTTTGSAEQHAMSLCACAVRECTPTTSSVTSGWPRADIRAHVTMVSPSESFRMNRSIPGDRILWRSFETHKTIVTYISVVLFHPSWTLKAVAYNTECLIQVTLWGIRDTNITKELPGVDQEAQLSFTGTPLRAAQDVAALLVKWQWS